MIKQGVFYISDRNQEIPSVLEEITTMNAEEILNAGHILHEFEYFQRRKEEIELNLNDFLRTISRYEKFFKEEKENRKKINFDYKRKAFVDINRALINYISSFKSFVEHISNELTKYYTKDSDQYKEFTTLTRELYDNNFCYKLLIRLRDFAVHSNYPIQAVHFVREHDGLRGYNYIVNVQFRKSFFLKNKALKQKIGKELNGYDELFDVIPFVNDLMPLINNLFVKFINLHKDYFMDSVVLIQNLKNKFHKTIGITQYEFEGSMMGQETKIIPIEMSEDFLKTLTDLSAS
jgi:hypothetical protein